MSTALLYDSKEALYGTSSPRLKAATPSLLSEPERPWAPSPPPPPPDTSRNAPIYVPDTGIILRELAPKHQELHDAPLPLELPTDPGFAMTDHVEGTRPREALNPGEPFQGELSIRDHHAQLNVKDLTEKATAGLLEHEAASKSVQTDEYHDPDSRHDSAQDKVPQLPPEKRQLLSVQEDLPPLRVQTNQDAPRQDHPMDTIATSPQLSKHLITTNDVITTLPAFNATSPVKEGSASSQQGEKLPSLHQVVGPQLGPLGELAEAATQRDARTGSRHHSQSFGSTSAPSPMPPYPYHNHPQSASSPYYHQHPARSPTSTISDQIYTSPHQYSNIAYYSDRRSSAPVDHPANFPPSLPSAGSSAESHGATNSSMDGYSTAQTTPGEAPDATTPRPILPPLHGMPQSSVVMGGGFRCENPGCNATFSTQYLLSSHKNVHSQVRNHYCSVEGCPRSEGGRGFKRKNEMIRHGLVHDSPGYVCPFCPDKEHKYPRPDNLQRHVRVHHVDKDKDDPLLREVLAQRREGLGTTRRRRANTAGSST